MCVCLTWQIPAWSTSPTELHSLLYLTRWGNGETNTTLASYSDPSNCSGDAYRQVPTLDVCAAVPAMEKVIKPWLWPEHCGSWENSCLLASAELCYDSSDLLYVRPCSTMSLSIYFKCKKKQHKWTNKSLPFPFRSVQSELLCMMSAQARPKSPIFTCWSGPWRKIFLGYNKQEKSTQCS